MDINWSKIFESVTNEVWNEDVSFSDDTELTDMIQESIRKARLYNIANEHEHMLFRVWIQEVINIFRKDFHNSSFLYKEKDPRELWKTYELKNTPNSNHTRDETIMILYLPLKYKKRYDSHFDELSGQWMQVGYEHASHFEYVTTLLMKHDYIFYKDIIVDLYPDVEDDEMIKRFFIHKYDPNKLLMLSYYKSSSAARYPNPLCLNFIGIKLKNEENKFK